MTFFFLTQRLLALWNFSSLVALVPCLAVSTTPCFQLKLRNGRVKESGGFSLNRCEFCWHPLTLCSSRGSEPNVKCLCLHHSWFPFGLCQKQWKRRVSCPGFSLQRGVNGMVPWLLAGFVCSHQEDCPPGFCGAASVWEGRWLWLWSGVLCTAGLDKNMLINGPNARQSFSQLF